MNDDGVSGFFVVVVLAVGIFALGLYLGGKDGFDEGVKACHNGTAVVHTLPDGNVIVVKLPEKEKKKAIDLTP